jgi:phosphatidate cytidylyltransferase
VNPEAAWNSHITLSYLLIAWSILAMAGIAIAALKYLAKKNVDAVWLTYRGWLMMVPFITVCIVAGRGTTIFAVALISILGVKEFARATGLYKDWWLTGAVYMSIVLLGVLAYVRDPRLGTDGWYGMYMAMPVYAIALLFTIPILTGRAKGQLQNASLAVMSFIYFGWMFGHLSLLTNTRNAYGYVFFIIFAVQLNDVAAYCCGKLFGKHKLNPEISPNKTWEGSIGAVLVSLAVPWLLHFSFPHFGPLQLILIGLLVGIGGQLGDLTISFIKRDIGIKDMGAAIPGHGGILDRVDSLVFVVPIFFHVTRWFDGA